MSRVDFYSIIEVTGCRVTKEQIERIYSRYRFASEFCTGKDILEVACGCGQGLGYLAKMANKVVGFDIDYKLLAMAKDLYRSRRNIAILKADAHNFPFADKSYDVVILYEAIYFLQDPDKAIREASRVLRDNGVILVSVVNKNWPDFNPSPYGHRYFSSWELKKILIDNGFRYVDMFGDCVVIAPTVKDRIVSLIKKIAIMLHVIPRTMKAKEFLKRIFVGKLKLMPAEVKDGIASYVSPSGISAANLNPEYKILFAVGYK